MQSLSFLPETYGSQMCACSLHLSAAAVQGTYEWQVLAVDVGGGAARGKTAAAAAAVSSPPALQAGVPLFMMPSLCVGDWPDGHTSVESSAICIAGYVTPPLLWGTDCYLEFCAVLLPCLPPRCAAALSAMASPRRPCDHGRGGRCSSSSRQCTALTVTAPAAGGCVWQRHHVAVECALWR